MDRRAALVATILLAAPAVAQKASKPGAATLLPMPVVPFRAAQADAAQTTPPAGEPSSSAAEPAPAPTTRTPGPGDPLPPLSMTYQSARMTGTQGTLNKGSVIWGDLHLEADTIEFDTETQRLSATGNVRIERGDERFTGTSFLWDPETGTGIAQNAVAISPPFYVSGERIERTATGLVAHNAMITPCQAGQGELKITARDVELVNNRYLVLRRPTFYLFGARILTVPRYRFVVRRGRRTEREEYSIPLRVRSSKIGGFVVGTTFGYYLGQGFGGNVTVDIPSKRPLQYTLRVNKDLLHKQSLPPERSPFVDPTRKAETGSPLRDLLTARPTPPPLDPVLDYEDILPAENPVEFPSLAAARELRASVTLQGNQEIGNKRRTELLLSRIPEARITGTFPLTPTPPPGDQITRAYLRRPRPVLSGEISAGQYEERELEAERRTTRRTRTTGSVGFGTLPLLLGDRFLFRPQVGYTVHNYGGGESYRIMEMNFAAEYVLGLRTAIGASYISRNPSGTTPLSFDVVETRSEAQARAQTAFGRYTIGFLGRYDLDTSQFFDYQFGLAIRLNCLEPRFTYRRLGEQIGFTLVIPGLTAF